MAAREFPLQHILFCVATALGRKGYCDDVPSELHEFLTGETPSFTELERFGLVTVICGLALLQQHPQLSTPVEVSLKPLRRYQDAFEDERPFQIWLANQQQKFGATLAVEPIPEAQYQVLAPTARDIVRRNFAAMNIDPTDTAWS